MFLDVASPSFIDGVSSDDIIFILIAVIIVICIIGSIVYLKAKKGRNMKDEKY